MHVIEAVLGLVLLATVVGAFAERLRTPAPSLLVVVGLGVGFLPGVPTVKVSPQLVLLGVLPPLLFAAAQQVSLIDLAAVWRPVAVLAVGLVAVTAAAVAGITHLVDGGIGVAAAFTLGAVLASTDPVAVTALSRQLRLPARVATLVQSESLFNDATSLVLFQVAVAAATSGSASVGGSALKFVEISGGGLLIGVVAGVLVGQLLARAGEPSVQAAAALLTPYVVAVAAEVAHVSSVTAVIVAGLMLARRRARARQPTGRLVATGVYDVVVFLLESAIFAVIGLQLAAFTRNLPKGDGIHALVLITTVTVTLLLVRGLGLGVGAVLPRLRRPRTATTRSWPVAAVVTWAGARGVVPLAAALSIPLTLNNGDPFPHRSLLLVVATGVVVVTLVVQGTTLAPLVRRLGVVGDDDALDNQRARARYAITAAALGQLDELADASEVPPAVVDRLRHELQQDVDVARRVLDAHGGATATVQRAGELRRRLLETQARELGRLRVAGEISAEVFRELQRGLDLEEARLGH